MSRRAASDGQTGNRQVPSQVLAAAAQLFRRKGYAATSTREIASALGMQKASLYHHISSKEDLLFQLSREVLGEILAGAGQLDQSGDPVESVAALIELHLTTMIRNRDKHQVMLIELRSLPPSPRAVVVKLRDEYEAFVRSVIERGQKAGAIDPEIDAKYLALALLNLLNWTIFWYKPGAGMSVAEVTKLMTRVFLHGVLVPQPSAGTDRLAAKPSARR
ncbi:TetR/AcrR family transcriptional regulator [bacterium]|nr:MAG: TetR/AcrR family transcriptional regulator [bacterium]